MWIRSRDVWKTILRKLRVDGSVRRYRGSWLVASISKPKYMASGKEAHRMKELVMAKVIEFYVPQNFKSPQKWFPQVEMGKIIEFCEPTVKSA